MASQSRGIVSLPASGGEAGLNRYLAEIKKFPILSPEEEFMLAKRWREQGDTEAAAKVSVYGALQLYLDFINMFQFLLSLVGNRNQ